MTGQSEIQPSSHRGFWPWRVSAIIAVILFVTGVGFVMHMGPQPATWYPPCPLRATTGLLCPGCGSARVLHDLAHGHLLEACGHNILVVVVIPFLAIWGIMAVWRGLLRNAPPPKAPLGTAKIVLVVVIVFGVARNLPWWPFTLLAPS